MVKPFISMNVGNMRAQVGRVNARIDHLEAIALEATRQAIGEIVNDMLASAQLKINVRSGELQGSGVVLDPVITATEISQLWGFNKEYARMRDQGGDIRPVNAQLLAIPLDPIMTATGARYSSPREEADLELVPILEYLFLADKNTGEFHWLLTPHVHQEGNGFVTKTAQEGAPNVSKRIAQIIEQLLGSAGGAK